jgi:hypothetical protein
MDMEMQKNLSCHHYAEAHALSLRHREQVSERLAFCMHGYMRCHLGAAAPRLR